MAANKPGKEAILAAFFDEGNYSPLFTDANDEKALEKIVKGICFDNAKRYFNL